MAEKRSTSEEAKRIENLLKGFLTGINGIGEKRSEHLIKHLKENNISTIKDAEAHLKSKEFHSHPKIPKTIKTRIEDYYGTNKDLEEQKRLEEEEKINKEELESISEQEKLAILQRRELERQIQERERQERKRKGERIWGKTKAGFRLGGKVIKWGTLGAAGVIVGAASPTGLLILSLTIHIIDLTFNFEAFGLRFLMYFFLTFWSWFTIFGATQENFLDIKRLKLPLILSTIAFLLPYARTLDFVPKESFDYILVLFPIWVWYILFSGIFRQTRFLKILRLTALIIVVVMLYPVAASFAEETGLGKIKIGNVEVNKVVKETKNKVLEGFKDAGKKISSIPTEIKKKYNESISYATGDYYTGQVDKNVKEPLGVYITNIETADPEVYEDEAIEIWANLRAKSIEEPIDSIKVQCIADKYTREEKQGKSKVSEFNNFIEEEEDLDCKFEEGDLDTGSHLVTFTAEFDFTTLAYLKTYFIDDNRLKALKREEIDVFKEYGITDKNPIAIYTNGPVGIGMETKTPPIGISKDYDDTPKFGITIENKWKGKIKKIEDLIIYLPEGIEIEDNCDEAFEKLETGNYLLEGYSAYKLVDYIKNEAKEWKDIELYKSRNCRLNIKDKDKILGDAPISTKYIKARIKYIYNSEESININVQTPKGFNVYFDPKRPSLKDDIKCVASHSDLYVIRAPFEIFKGDDTEPITRQTVECGTKSNKCDYTIPKSYFKRGDEIKCKVLKAELSNEEEETDSVSVTIQNSAPTITVFFEPKQPTTETKELKCIGVIKDEENDECLVIYEVKINNEKIGYDYINPKPIEDKKQFQILINSEKLKEDGKLKENDKISCKMTAIDRPTDPKFDRKESEPDEINVIVGKATTTGSSGTGTSSNLNADCNLEENHGHACGGSTKRNCYYYKEEKRGECLTECEFLGKTGTHSKIKDGWKCACNKASWKEQCEDESFLACVTGHCPEDMNMYCCDAVGLLG